ncbi:MAG: 50S ribosomal protein L1 [Thermoplasmata archaeon]|nr:50S ribosomal protein L1 [Thermoplasmata archaeon]
MPDPKIVEVVKKVLEESPQRKFLESVELAVNLKNVDLKNQKNKIDEDILLPKGRGKDIKIGVFGTGEFALKAKNAKADKVISPEEIETIASNKRTAKKLASEITFFIAEAPLMITIGKRLGPVLAPRGKMPRPLPPAADPGPVIQNLRRTVKVKTKDKPTLHVVVGSREMKPEDIAENIEAVINRIVSKLEKGKANLGTVYLKTTMGPAHKLM